LSSQCSTPYGIRGLGTTLTLHSTVSQTLCSTPYGIRGLGTHMHLVAFGQPEACSTPYGIRGLGTRSTKTAPPRTVGAQRLTASEVWAPSCNEWFRSRTYVLNALRHQRFGHRQPDSQTARQTECSTPYGIRGLGTFPQVAAWENASECSTPYGIRGLGTYIAGVATAGAYSAQRLTASEVWAPSAYGVYTVTSVSAQRLTASEVWAPPQREPGHELRPVLNALRHQRFGHPS